ncbi:helix-turn-helix domain-containing protein [Flammeovirga pectinis]|nr:AraC family transcriptional regulator [Flammeovirga pectinis]
MSERIEFIQGSSTTLFRQLEEIYNVKTVDNQIVVENSSLNLTFNVLQPFDGIEIIIHKIKFFVDTEYIVKGSEIDNYIYFKFNYKASDTIQLLDDVYDYQSNDNGMSIYSTGIPLIINYKVGDVAEWVSVRISKDYYHNKLSFLANYIGEVFNKENPWAVFDIVPLKVYLSLKEIMNQEHGSRILKNGIIVSKVIECLAYFLDRVIDRERLEKPNQTIHPDDLILMSTIKNELLSLNVKTPSLTDLSKQYGISVSKLKRDFNSVFGTSVHKFHLDYKLETSRILLTSQSYSITEVSRKLGFSRVSKFSLAFKNKFGYSPKDIAQKFQK